jgi:hypothetical protein
LTDRLEIALPLAVLFGCLSSVLGYSGALSTNTSVAGMIAVASCFLFLISWIFAPKHGRFANLLRRFRLRLQIATDDLLAVIYRREESGRLLMNHGESVVISNGLLGWLTKNRAVRKGWLDSRSYVATDCGNLFCIVISSSPRTIFTNPPKLPSTF